MLVDLLCLLTARFLPLVPRVGWPESDCSANCCTIALASSAEAVPVVNEAAIENGSERRIAATAAGEVDARGTVADRVEVSAPLGIIGVGGVVWIGLNDTAAAIDVAILGRGRARSKTTVVPRPVAKMMLNACSIAVCVAPSECGWIR